MECFCHRLSGEIKTGLDFLKSYNPVDKLLTYNIRTPKKTFEFACKLGRKDNENEGLLNSIADPQFIQYKNPEDGFTVLASTIEYLIKEQKSN